MREVAAELEKPVLLFSGGKDSIVLLRLAEKAFRPGAVPVPGHARGHGPQLPRGDRVPRPPRRRAGRAADRRLRAGLDRQGPRRRGDRPARVAQPAADRRRCSTRSPSTASTRRSAARAATRSARGPRSGSSPSATTSASGTRGASARSLEPLQRPRAARRARARVPDLQLDRARRVGVHRSPRARDPAALHRRTSARCSSATGCSTRSRDFVERMDGEEPFTEWVRYRTVGDMTCTGAVRSTRDDARGRRGGDRRHAGDRARRDPRRRPRVARPRWRTASARATSSGTVRAGARGRPPAATRRSCCASPPPARSTTASRR